MESFRWNIPSNPVILTRRSLGHPSSLCSASRYVRWAVWMADLCLQGQQDCLLRCRAVMNNLDRLMLAILRLSRLLIMFLSDSRKARKIDLWDFHEEPAHVCPGSVLLSVAPSESQGPTASLLHHSTEPWLPWGECRQADEDWSLGCAA